MNTNNNNYCVILAGGKGRRLWPCSREAYPKQFIDFFGSGKTQLQTVYDLMASFIPEENIFVCTNREYKGIVTEQIAGIDVLNVLAEPVNRNTAASVAWAMACILSRNSRANVVVAPADLLVFNEQAFRINVTHGLEFVAEHNDIMNLGVKPTRPEPGYGYVQVGDAMDDGSIFRVRSFTEKPEREFAKVFMESGEFYWNTGLFLGNARSLCDTLARLFNDTERRMESFGYLETFRKQREEFDEYYSSLPNLSLDYGILDHSDNVCVMKCDFGWADIGTWHSFYESQRRSEDDNVVLDSEVILDGSTDNVIKLPKGKIGVINGLHGYIVVEDGNVLLICKKGDTSALVRKYVNEVQMKYGEKYI